MTNHVERVMRGGIASEHILQLFDSDESLAVGVSQFLAAGAREGANLLVVARRLHWSAIQHAFAEAGADVPALEREGRLTVVNAATLLATFMQRGGPNRAAFDANVGALVRKLAGPPLYIYGEMVDILANEADLRGAGAVEELWNELSATASFKLLCGYSSTNFAPESAGGMLRKICGAHSRVVSDGADPLGAWLLGRGAARQPA